MRNADNNTSCTATQTMLFNNKKVKAMCCLTNHLTAFELTEITKFVQAENPTEAMLMNDATWQRGVLWGIPRAGHPEGKVLYHIAEVLSNIDQLSLSPNTRRQLRLITLIHDTLKFKEDRSLPRNWEKHHARLAYQFAKNLIADEEVLTVIATHDDAYHAWCKHHFLGDEALSRQCLKRLEERVAPFLQLYYLFFKCDTTTGDKNLAPVLWFEEQVKGIEVVPLVRSAALPNENLHATLCGKT